MLRAQIDNDRDSVGGSGIPEVTFRPLSFVEHRTFAKRSHVKHRKVFDMTYIGSTRVVDQASAHRCNLLILLKKTTGGALASYVAAGATRRAARAYYLAANLPPSRDRRRWCGNSGRACPFSSSRFCVVILSFAQAGRDHAMAGGGATAPTRSTAKHAFWAAVIRDL